MLGGLIKVNFVAESAFMNQIIDISMIEHHTVSRTSLPTFVSLPVIGLTYNFY